MRLTSNLYAVIFIASSFFGFANSAKADPLVLGLDQTSAVQTVAANTTVSQDVQFSALTNIDGIAFFLTDPSGAPLTYSITDITTSTLVFSQTFDDTTLNPTLTNIAIPEGTKSWLELYTAPILIHASSDVYAFSVSGAGGLKIGIDPTAFTEIGLAPVGDAVLGLRVYDPPPVADTPEPDSLALVGTAVLASAGALRRRFLQS